MPHIELPSGIRIRYDERGPADGRPLVLAHGFGVSLEMWMPQMQALSERYRLITWDARGHGGSSAPDDLDAYSMPLLAVDLRGLLEGLDALDGAVVGGMSFGGMIAQQYAVQYSTDHVGTLHALILSDTTTRGDEQPAPSNSQTYEEWAGDPGLEGARHAMVTRPDLTRALQEVQAPTLIMAGTLDERIMGGLQRLDGIPHRRIVRLDGCFHGTSAQRPGDWAREVLRFLDDVEAGAELGEDEVR